MPTAILLLALLAGGDAAAVKPVATPTVLSLSETIAMTPVPQGAPGMMDKRADSFQTQGSAPARSGSRWAPGRTMVQGYFGVLNLSDADREGGSIAGAEGGDDFESIPTLGGGGMYKIGGQRIDWGLEGMLAFSGRANAAAFVAGGGGAAIAVDVDLLVFDLYGGPFISAFLGDRLRAYGAAGGLLQWASWDQDGAAAANSGDGDGFGGGVYARTGLEFLINPGMLLGFGARWSDSTVDLSGSLGDLDLEGVQYVVTVSRWL